MTGSDAISKWADRFEGITTADMEDINTFILMENLSEKKIEDLYFCVLHTHESRKMPNIAKIKKYWHGMMGYSDSSRKDNKYDEIISHNAEIKERWKTFPLERVVSILVFIKKKALRDGCDTEFWTMYGDLFWEAAALKEQGFQKEDRMHRLEYILQRINAGEEYESARTYQNTISVSEIRDRKTQKIGGVLIDAASGEVVNEEEQA